MLLGMLCVESPEDESRLRAGVQLLQVAAAKNNAEALHDLANLHSTGRGAAPSDLTAFEFTKRAAEFGNSEAQYKLATMYANGRGGRHSIKMKPCTGVGKR